LLAILLDHLLEMRKLRNAAWSRWEPETNQDNLAPKCG
jgi:hypothetical protein